MNEAISPDNKRTGEEARILVDPTWKGVYRIGGVALLLAGIFYLIGTILGNFFGAPGNTEAYLQALAAYPTLAQITYSIFGLTDLLLVFGILALYLALKGVNKNAMLVATGLVGFFIIFDFGITEFNTLTLVTLIQNYAAATNEAQRAMYVAAEHYALATMPIATFLSWSGPCSGFLITSIVMLKGVFRKVTARLGIIANTLAIIGGFYFLHPVPAYANILTAILLAYGLWLLFVGLRVFNLRKQQSQITP